MSKQLWKEFRDLRNEFTEFKEATERKLSDMDKASKSVPKVSKAPAKKPAAKKTVMGSVSVSKNADPDN